MGDNACGAAHAKDRIIFGAADFVGVPINAEVDFWILKNPFGLGVHDPHGFFAERVLVKRKIYRRRHVIAKLSCYPRKVQLLG